MMIPFIFLVFSLAAFSQDMELFLLIGQSNMAGRGVIEEQDRVPFPRVFTLTKEETWVPAVEPIHFDRPDRLGTGLGRSFGRVLAEAAPGARIGLIPAAMGGSARGQGPCITLTTLPEQKQTWPRCKSRSPTD